MPNNICNVYICKGTVIYVPTFPNNPPAGSSMDHLVKGVVCVLHILFKNRGR